MSFPFFQRLFSPPLLSDAFFSLSPADHAGWRLNGG